MLTYSAAASRMPAFQPINAARPPADAPRTEDTAIEHRRRRLRHTSRSRSPSPDLPELASRDWTLVKIVDKMVQNGVFMYKTEWEPTMLDVSFIRERNDTHHVRYRGRNWTVEVLAESVVNADTGILEAQVSWEDTWHPLWEFTSALDSVVDYEVANDPEKDMSEKTPYWWRYPIRVPLHRDPQAEFDPALCRGFDEDEIIPELHGDYTLGLMNYLIDKLASGESPRIIPGSIADLLNQPMRQRLIFRSDYVESGKAYRLHRAEFVRAAVAAIIGHARIDPCNVCIEFSTRCPFSGCITSMDMFKGYATISQYRQDVLLTFSSNRCCANSVALAKTKTSDLHLRGQSWCAPPEGPSLTSSQCASTSGMGLRSRIARSQKRMRAKDHPPLFPVMILLLVVLSIQRKLPGALLQHLHQLVEVRQQSFQPGLALKGLRFRMSTANIALRRLPNSRKPGKAMSCDHKTPQRKAQRTTQKTLQPRPRPTMQRHQRRPVGNGSRLFMTRSLGLLAGEVVQKRFRQRTVLQLLPAQNLLRLHRSRQKTGRWSVRRM